MWVAGVSSSCSAKRRLPAEIEGLSYVEVVVETSSGLRNDSGKYIPVEIPLSDDSALLSHVVGAFPDLECSSAEDNISTTELSIDDGTCIDIDIVTRADSLVFSSTIEAGDLPLTLLTRRPSRSLVRTVLSRSVVSCPPRFGY